MVAGSDVCGWGGEHGFHETFHDWRRGVGFPPTKHPARSCLGAEFILFVDEREVLGQNSARDHYGRRVLPLFDGVSPPAPRQGIRAAVLVCPSHERPEAGWRFLAPLGEGRLRLFTRGGELGV
jgi:hypothetical protein